MKPDPQFEGYLREVPSLTYVQEDDPFLRTQLIDKLEIVLGRKKMERVYYELKRDDFDVQRFFQSALSASKIRIEHLGIAPSELPTKGPLVFLANHPFGIVDGMVLSDLAAKACGNFRILINSALCQDKDLAPYFLPVDFDETREAMRTNIRSKQLALESLSNNVPILIFPSGMVSTAGKKGFGRVQDGPWTTFAAKLVRESQASVVPVYFHGQNSRKFHIASHIAEPLRMGMLIHEAIKKFDSSIQVAIGETIDWNDLKGITTRKALTEELYSRVQGLKKRGID